MSWSSIDDDDKTSLPVPGRRPSAAPTTTPVMRVFGKSIPVPHLEHAGYAVAKHTYIGRRDEVSFNEVCVLCLLVFQVWIINEFAWAQGDKIAVLKAGEFLPVCNICRYSPLFNISCLLNRNTS